MSRGFDWSGCNNPIPPGFLAIAKPARDVDLSVAKVAAARETIAQNTVAGLIELDPALALRGLREGVFDDDLPAADRKRLRARAKAAQRDRRAQAERGQARDRAAAAADGARRLMVLEGAIGRGEAGKQAIAEAADILDNPTRVRLHEKLDAKHAEDAARDRRIENVSAVLAGRAPATGDGEGDGKPDGGGVKDENLRPDTPEWRQAVDDHYASLADTLETMDPDERGRFEDDYAQATGVLPGPVLKQVRAGLLSADPAEQAAAAQRLARLQDVDPGLVSVIPADERRRAGAIAEFADLGLPPPRAVELAEEKPAQAVIASKDFLGGEADQPAGGAGDDTLAAGGPGDDTPDKGVTEDELIERIAALSEDVLDLAETGRLAGDAEDEPLVMAKFNELLKIFRFLGNLLGRKGGQDAAREGAKGTVGKMVEQLARKAGRRIQKKILDQSRRTGKGAGRQGKDREAGGLAKDIVPVATEAVVAAVRRKFQELNEERIRAGKKEKNKVELVPNDLRPGAGNIEAIQSFVEAWENGKLLPRRRQVAQLNLDEVDDAWAAQVKKDTARLQKDAGVDVAGLRHAIDTGQLGHAFGRHGPGNQEDPDQIPISPEAVSVYLDVIKNYDAITDVRRKGAGTTIRFEKAVDGVVAVVEQVRTGEKTLSFFDMWIMEAK